MTSSSDRPVPRSRPRRPADEGTDPVVGTVPAPSGASLTERAHRRGPEPTVQLNVRIAADISELIDHQVESTGRTKRQLIEQAIRQAYS